MSTESGTESLTSAVLESFAETPNQRLKEILGSLTKHLHAFIAEVEPSIEEWEAGIDFLTATGQKCDSVRQEFILLSDVLGVSMLVETINDAETPDATDSTVLGPFHMVESPKRGLGENISPESEGDICVVRGRILSVTGQPIPRASIDVWQANMEGFYDVQQPGIQSIGNGRGLFTADDNGEFYFRSVVPSYYPIPTDGPVGDLLAATNRHPNRPAHIHFIVAAPGYKELTTHIFVGGSEYIESDAVFAVKESLIKPFTTNTDPDAAAAFGVNSPFVEGLIDIVLHPEIHAHTPTHETTKEIVR
ncbi:Hydroxyquinol 1,2-dioxygenase [Arthrobacter sp. 9V]|uniref:dioxygenase family protein n=1 Tax=Arthrobacter sp. 9V TaxID=2653132 RepID=UPI0012F0E399|nr:dioxygenase [Arthrobacter sp. 9V]VXC42793.1 Hydroxyquinol 1,2-dioxygenase [Arthrobacter sp. 9V]